MCQPVKIVARINYFALILCLGGTFFSTRLPAGVFDAYRDGGSGFWSNPWAWNTYPYVPNNVGVKRYNVYIDGGYTGYNTVVALDMYAAIDTLTIDQGDSLIIQNYNVLDVVQGNITNNGNIEINSAGNVTALGIYGSTTLSGMGTIRMGNNANNQIRQLAGSTPILTNDTNHTIAGSGQLGAGSLAIINKGLINADQTTAMMVNPGSSGMTNLGIMQASNGGTMQLGYGTFTNTGHVIQALDGSTVQLLSNSTVVDGTFSTMGSGVFQVPNYQVAYLSGTIANNATLEINSTGNTTALGISGSTTLSGAGTIRMGDNASNQIRQVEGSNPTLTNDTNHTIAGSGQLGAGALPIINKGLINADQTTALTVSPGSSGMTNLGIMQASNGGTLNLQGTLTQLVGSSLTGGTWVVMANSTLNITTGSNITINQGNVTLDGVGSTFTKINTLANNQGSFSILEGRNFTTAGNLANSGTITVGNGSEFDVNGGITGTGNFVVNGGSLSTDYFLGNTLTICAGGVVRIEPLSGGPLAAQDQISPVPEPATTTLLLLAGLGLGLWRLGKRGRKIN
jgi:hypothetical protein